MTLEAVLITGAIFIAIIWLVTSYSRVEYFQVGPARMGRRFYSQTPLNYRPYETPFCEERKSAEPEPKAEKKMKFTPKYETAEEYYKDAMDYICMGSYSKAIEPLRQAINLNSGYAQAYIALGMVYNKIGCYEESIEPLQTAARLKPNNVNALCLLGMAHNATGSYDGAVKAFNDALAVDSRDAEAHFGLGLTYYRRGDLALAKGEYGFLKNGNSYLAREFSDLIAKSGEEDEYIVNKKFLKATSFLSGAIRKKEKMESVRSFLTKEEERLILDAVGRAELRTSGEIKVRIAKNAGEDPMMSARAAFDSLGMRGTCLRNGVLFYMAVDDRVFVILGDDGINRKVPPNFWDKVRDVMMINFKDGLFVNGLAEGIKLAGEQLEIYFPHKKEDINELPDAISYG